ncbi:DUF5358 domain-containing protein [Gallibacterium genomosp. 3]|uniref:Bifunctional riboflavin kinase/FMN adenylyltransferase n=1 Tax=Gallibacterium genomosp. 3 TaxID=505345 RepID=A0A1A7QCW3_9PAST|nr:DUF5358 domain-containing protein [Gallibacterium genomosp. 3]OBX11245.1 hypothetical protein QV07_01970 [Gallibacterium genomosp. 3]
MLKKLFFSTSILLLVGCASQDMDSYPAEYANADYELSNEDAQRWVIASHQAEQCIYPNLTRIQQEHFSKEDAYIHSQYVFFYPLESIIGTEYVKMIQADEKSMGYAQFQFKKFKDTAFESMPAADCATLRIKARDDLKVVKGQYQSGMAVDEAKNNASSDSKKNPDGIATNENKFFFDIIKWGSALLLL